MVDRCKHDACSPISSPLNSLESDKTRTIGKKNELSIFKVSIKNAIHAQNQVFTVGLLISLHIDESSSGTDRNPSLPLLSVPLS